MYYLQFSRTKQNEGKITFTELLCLNIRGVNTMSNTDASRCLLLLRDVRRSPSQAFICHAWFDWLLMTLRIVNDAVAVCRTSHLWRGCQSREYASTKIVSLATDMWYRDNSVPEMMRHDFRSREQLVYTSWSNTSAAHSGALVCVCFYTSASLPP